MAHLDKSVAIVGAGDYIGSAIAKKFASEGYLVVAGRRNGDKLEPLVAEIEAAGGRISARSLDAREPEDVTAFLAEADALAPLALTIFNVGANVNFPILETTDRVFRKVWEMAAFSGFLAGREAARHMVPRGRGTILFTGATASMRGAAGFSAFSGAKHALRALAQSMARELGPQGIHVGHIVLDGAVDGEFIRGLYPDWQERLENDRLLTPAHIAEEYVRLWKQPRDAWTHELDLRPYGENW